MRAWGVIVGEGDEEGLSFATVMTNKKIVVFTLAVALRIHLVDVDKDRAIRTCLDMPYIETGSYS